MSELTKNLAQNLVAIISDFGLIDNYAGVMKGVMLDIASPLEIVDITHQVPPQNVLVARFALATAVAYFPAGTVFLSVVDPGVGTGRRAIAARTKSHYFVGPDNGIFSAVFERDPAIAAVELNNSNYWRDAQPSSTFHGRDIFAPAAAHLANGVALKQLGEAIAPDSLVSLSPPQPKSVPGGWQGSIQYVDHFGNLITNIPGDRVPNNLEQGRSQSWRVQIGDTQIPGRQAYGAAEPGELLALVGSHGWVEIAQNQGSGAIALGLTYGDHVQVLTAP